MAPHTVVRPDGRTFVSLRGVAPDHYRRELEGAIAASERPVHINVDLADSALVATCGGLGMTSCFESKWYQVPFASALKSLRTAPHPPGFDLRPANEVDQDALFALDIELRQDVPGTDGWAGNRDWFDEEMRSTMFCSTAYLVARNTASGQLCGLVRFWRKADMPRLGLLAVLPDYRTGLLAHALLRSGLTGASAWGFVAFEADSARPALQRRLQRMGGIHTRTFAQMVTRG